MFVFGAASEQSLSLQRCQEQPVPSCLEGELGGSEESANWQTKCTLIACRKR